MAVVTTITRSQTHNQSQKRILSKNKGVKIKASVNCKMEIPALNFPAPSGLSFGSLTGVMSEKNPSNIIYETSAQLATKKDKETKKKAQAPTNNTTAYRKSMRLLIRNSNSLAEKYSSGVPYPFEMPRTVELLDTDPTKIGSENLKILYMAGIGLYRRPDERGMGYQRQLLQEECENFVNSQDIKHIINSSSEIIHHSPVNINNAIPEISSPIMATSKTDENSKLKWRDANSNWDVNMTVVITPVNQNCNNEFNSQISSPSENSLESDLETTSSPSDCNDKASNSDSDEGWQSFGSFIEAQLRDEIIVKPKCSIEEIEEAKLKIERMTKEWNIFLKGP